MKKKSSHIPESWEDIIINTEDSEPSECLPSELPSTTSQQFSISEIKRQDSLQTQYVAPIQIKSRAIRMIQEDKSLKVEEANTDSLEDRQRRYEEAKKRIFK